MKYTINDFFLYYIEMSGDANCQKLFEAEEKIKLLEAITEEQANYSYAPNKWSLKQVVGHMTDHERIMTYRALRISRKDDTPLLGYDQNVYADNSNSKNLPFKQVLEDYKNTRKASISFMNCLSQEQWKLKGKIWKFHLSLEETMRAVIGHDIHHFNVIQEKYKIL